MLQKFFVFTVMFFIFTLSTLQAQKQGQEKIDSHLKELRNAKEYTHDYFSQNEKNRDDVAVMGVSV